MPYGEGHFVCFPDTNSLRHVYWMRNTAEGLNGPFVYLGHKRIKKKKRERYESNKTQLIREVLTPQGVKTIYGHDFRHLKPLKD